MLLNIIKIGSVTLGRLKYHDGGVKVSWGSQTINEWVQ